jgi:hypothetical protein
MSNSNIDNQTAFNKFLDEFNQPNVKETLCLFNCMKINQKFNKTEVKDYTLEELYEFLDSYTTKGIVELLQGQYHGFIKDGPLEYDEELMKDFVYLNFSQSFPKFKNFPPYNTLKNKLITKINNIFEKDTYHQDDDKLAKYNSYVFLTIRYMLTYCIKIDKDFEGLAKELPAFTKENELDNPNLPTYINGLLKSYLADPYNQAIHKEMASVMNIWTNKFTNKIAKIPNFGSHHKGQLGETIYSSINNSELVGYKNNKIDLIENGNGVSLKSSYTKVWNSHLAYLNDKEHNNLISHLKENKPLSKLPIDWTKTIHQFMTNHEDIKDLVFQKLTVDELDKTPKSINLWKFEINEIIKIIENKQFIFNNNGITLYYEQEQLMKINFKKRSDNIQVLILTDENALNNSISNGLGVYHSPINKGRKQKI